MPKDVLEQKFDTLDFNIGVTANAFWQWGLVQQNTWIRPITIGGDHNGNFEIDEVWGQTNDNDMIYLDATQNKGNPFSFSLNHMGWLNPLTQLNVTTSGFVAIGVLTMRMWYEIKYPKDYSEDPDNLKPLIVQIQEPEIPPDPTQAPTMETPKEETVRTFLGGLFKW